MKPHKFTICYRHVDTGAIFCDHVEARNEGEAALKAIEARINSERAKPYDKNILQDRAAMTIEVARHQLLFAFRGHQKQLL